MGGGDLLKKLCSLLLKSVVTLPRMLLYFLQPITFNESAFRDIFEDKKMR